MTEGGLQGNERSELFLEIEFNERARVIRGQGSDVRQHIITDVRHNFNGTTIDCDNLVKRRIKKGRTLPKKLWK